MTALIRESVQRMHGYTPGEQPKATDIIKLNTNENPYPPSPKVAAALARLEIGSLRRYPDPMASAVRRRLAEVYGFAPEQVFAGNGSDESLALATRAFVEHQGAIGAFDPSYSLYPVLAEIREVAYRPVALGEGFSWRMPPDYAASLFYIANPNAPTGMLFPRHEVEAFVDRFPGVVVIDEAYVDFAGEDCLELARTRENVLVMRTMSKSFSLAGMRIGYAFGAPALIEALNKVKDSYNLDLLAQTVALAALDDMPWMERNAVRIRQTRTRLSAALERMGFSVVPSAANFVWARPPRRSARELFEALKAQRIYVRFFDDERIRDYLRISVGTDAEIDTFVERLQKEMMA